MPVGTRPPAEVHGHRHRERRKALLVFQVDYLTRQARRLDVSRTRIYYQMIGRD